MTNVITNMNKDKTKLTVEIDLTNDAGLSKSGKSQVIATTSGNITLDGGIKLGLNCYRPV